MTFRIVLFFAAFILLGPIPGWAQTSRVNPPGKEGAYLSLPGRMSPHEHTAAFLQDLEIYQHDMMSPAVPELASRQRISHQITGHQNRVEFHQRGRRNDMHWQLSGDHNRIRAVQSGTEHDISVRFTRAEGLELGILQLGAGHQVEMDIDPAWVETGAGFALPVKIEQNGHRAPPVIIHSTRFYALPIHIRQ